MDAYVGMTPPGFGGRRTVEFDRRAAGLTGLAIRGLLLSLITFGIYRFWYMTQLRRFFWSRTLVDGSPGEYTGTGRELFLGFLVALAILVPIYIAIFAVSVLVAPLAPFAGLLSFATLFLLGKFALYRGRRYRASRTLWRGLRLGQDGSAVLYAARAAGWWLLTLLTLGLAFPFMRAALERYRLRHTLIGTTRMGSDATGRSILLPWLLLYAAALLPVIAAGLAFLAANDFAVPTDLLVPRPDGKAGGLALNPAYQGTRVAAYGVGVLAAAGLGLCLVPLLLPYYRARETRAFMATARLGSARLVSTLRARQFYWPYVLYVLSLVAFVGLVGAVMWFMTRAATAAGGSGAHWAVALGGLAFYLGGALLLAVLNVRVIQARLWGAIAATTTIDDPEALNRLSAADRGSGSGLQEGLADALDVGGALQIGF